MNGSEDFGGTDCWGALGEFIGCGGVGRTPGRAHYKIADTLGGALVLGGGCGLGSRKEESGGVI